MSMEDLTNSLNQAANWRSTLDSRTPQFQTFAGPAREKAARRMKARAALRDPAASLRSRSRWSISSPFSVHDSLLTTPNALIRSLGQRKKPL